MSLQGTLAVLLNRKKLKLDQKVIDDLTKEYGAHSWFAYIVKDRANRPDLWKTSFYLAPRLKSDARILETGCGTGTNLLWFAENGFKNLYGLDIDQDLLNIGKRLSEVTGYPMQLWKDDGLNPQHLPKEPFDAILALNWTFLVDSYELSEFLATYAKHLNVGGYLLIDIIDTSYSNMPNNQYLTSDLGKPENERQPSEYRKRYSKEEVAQAAQSAGLKVEKQIVYKQEIPKSVFVLRK